MMSLFSNSFAPITHSMGFLKAPLDSVADAYLMWRRQHFKNVDCTSVTDCCRSALKRLEPLTTPPRRTLLYSTSSPWTAYFDNGCRGPDPFPPISYLAERLGCRGLVATNVPHTLLVDVGCAKGTYGAIQFELFAPMQTEFLNYERQVSLTYDGGKWKFETLGDVQPFEDISRYVDRSIIGRFTPEMLEQYCHAVGVNVFTDDFYVGPGCLIAIHDPLPATAMTVTLEDARRDMLLGSAHGKAT